jgi:hypothetical protein
MSGGKWMDQLLSMMQRQQAAPPDRQGYAERLISAGQRPSQNVSFAPPEPAVYDYPPDPRTAWTPLSDEIRDMRREQEIGYPFPSEPGFETQTGPMPDLSQGIYNPASAVDMGPYPPAPAGPAAFIRPPSDPRRR